MGTSRNSRAWIAFHCFPESLKVIGDGLAELVELGEEILGAGKLHGQLAGLEIDPRGEALEAIGGLGAQGDGDGGGLAVFMGLVDLNHNPLVAHRLKLKLLASGDLLELADEIEAIDEESFPHLVAAEAVQQPDGLPAWRTGCNECFVEFTNSARICV